MADIKLRRIDKLKSFQRDMTSARNESLIESVQGVIFDSSGNGMGNVDQTWADCPQTEQKVCIRPGKVMVGEIYRVHVDAKDRYDLIRSQVRE